MNISSSILGYDLDLIRGTLQWNDALYAVWGYEPSEPANNLEWWTDHVHPEDAMIINQAMDRLLDPSVSEWTVVYRFRRADNVYIRAVDQATVIRNETGKAIRLTGFISPMSSAI